VWCYNYRCDKNMSKKSQPFDNFSKLIINQSLILFLVSIFFDFFISYYQFVKDEIFFVTHEANKEFVSFVCYGNVPFFILFGHILIFLFFYISLRLYRKKQSNLYSTLLSMSVLTLVTISALHFYGGFSWLL